MTTSIPHKPHAGADNAEDGAEARMRQALGKLGTARPGKPEPPRRTTYQAKPGTGRHRFKQDGEVPVVKLTLAQSDRTGERQLPAPIATMSAVQVRAGEGRDQGSGESARQVQELTEQLRSTQTRLGHAELARNEAEKAARERQQEAADLRQALGAAEAALAQARAELVASERAREELERRQETVPPSRPKADERDDAATRRKVGRPFGSTNRVRDQEPGNDPKPVKWWAGD
ncbi:MAG: hypothetical protein ACRYG8_31600 [Janthinobacterium lividum]